MTDSVSVKKDRTLFLTGAVLFALSLRGRPFSESMSQVLFWLQVALLISTALGAWFRRFRWAWGSALVLALVQLGLPLWKLLRGAPCTPEVLLPVLLWGIVLAVNFREERREVYFNQDA